MLMDEDLVVTKAVYNVKLATEGSSWISQFTEAGGRKEVNFMYRQNLIMSLTE